MYTPLNKQIFPHVGLYSTFMSQVGDKEEIRSMNGYGPEGFTTVSYMISTPTTFDNLFARECRGIVFNQDNMVVARPLHKFFNMNERDGARPHDFDWSTLMRVMDKRDGSMIHTVNVGGSFKLKSKKSFESEVSVAATKWMSTRQNYIDFCQRMIDEDCTAIFEYTAPTARIVLPYQDEMMTLLHIRDNMSGRYSPPGELLVRAYEQYRIPIVETDRSGADELNDMLSGDRSPATIWSAVQHLSETVENIEGWVFQFENGDMVKVKTKWYIERHRVMTFLRERDIHLMVIKEEIDDLKAQLATEGVNISEIEMIEKQVTDVMKGILHEVDEAYQADKHLIRKDFAIKNRSHKYFNLMINLYLGKQPDVAEYYERNILPTVPLRQLNLLQSVAEAE